MQLLYHASCFYAYRQVEANRIAVASNAEAAKRAASDPESGAIAGEIAARIYDVPILALSQLSRAVERRTLQKEVTRLRQAVERVPGMDDIKHAVTHDDLERPRPLADDARQVLRRPYGRAGADAGPGLPEDGVLRCNHQIAP